MRKKKLLQKLTPILLIFVMFLSVLVPKTMVFAEGKEVKVTTTKFTITNSNGAIPSGGYTSSTLFKLNYEWDASNHENKLHEGDYFEIELPKQFKFPKESSYCNFNINAPNGEVLGNAVVTPTSPGGGKVRVTFTKYVNDKYDVKGDMHLTARWDNVTYPVNQESVFEIVVDSFHEHITLKPEATPSYENEILRKIAGQTLTDEGYVRWRIRINTKKANLSDVILTDTLSVKEPGSPEGIEYVEGQFILAELVWEDGKFIEKNEQNVSSQVVLSTDKRSFTYRMGNIDGKAYILHYRSTYKDGLILKNKAKLTAKDTDKVVENQFVDSSAGGGGQGNLTSKIKIIKVDSDNEEIKLKNAKFLITRKESGTSFELITNANGEAVSIQLIPGEYTIKEVDPPQNYILDDTEYTVTVSSDKVALATIKNKREETEVKVTKVWENTTSEHPTIKLQLLKNGQNESSPIELKNGTITYIWKKLQKTDAKGNDYVYTVKEVGETNNTIQLDGKWFEVKVKGSMKDGFTVTNKEITTQTPLEPSTTSLKVEKEWQDISPNEAPEITVYLVKNGKKTDEFIKLNKDNNWKGEFRNLKVVDDIKDMKVNTYTVAEDGEANGKIVLSGNEYKVTYAGGKIINTKVVPQMPLEPGKTSLKVEKEWKNTDAKDVPEVTVYLLKNGEKTDQSLKLNKDNNWKGEFKNLKVVDDIKDKKANVYTVIEKDEANGKVVLNGNEYKVTYAGGKIVNTKIVPQTPLEPSKTSLKVEKEWKGIDSKYAPEVTVYLVKNGIKTGKFIKLNKDNNWKGEFKELAAVDDIKADKVNIYTLAEDGEKDGKVMLSGKTYKVSYVGGKVINTKVEEPKDPEKPTPNTPDKPGKSDVPDTHTPNGTLPKTGDTSNIGLFAGLLAISGVLLVVTGYLKKRKIRDEK